MDPNAEIKQLRDRLDAMLAQMNKHLECLEQSKNPPPPRDPSRHWKATDNN